MKKFLIAILSAICVCSLCAACVTKDDSSIDSSDSSSGTIIEVPDGETIIPLPDDVTAPAKPTLPELDLLSAPYIGAVGSTTDAYTVGEIKENGKIVGAEVSYPASGKILSDYNFVWFDVYNYVFDYSNVRVDFESISGAEKVAVAAMYTDAYDKKYPAMGIMVESLMDGAMSFVSDMSKIKIADNDYKTTEAKLSDQTVCRLYVYIDSNPSQAPSDKEGSLKIAKISFLKNGDPLLNVDNSPKLGEVTANGYALEETDGVFKASYSTSVLTENSSVSVAVNRFVGAYGRVKLGYTANGAKTLKVSDGKNDIGTYALSASGEIVLDIRGHKVLSELKFVIDGGEAADATQRSFELTSVEFIYTPYVTDSWSATSKFWIEKDSGALGGKIKASYDFNVGWDYLSAKVAYYDPSYSLMVAKIKTYGDETSGIPERFGLSVNSNKVVLEVEYNTFESLEYDDQTGEYWLFADLSGVGKISALNFFFDSAYIEKYDGTRSIEFTSIEFYKSNDDVVTGHRPETDAMKDPYVCNYEITSKDDGFYNVSWSAENKQEWGKTSMLVKWYDPAYKYLKLTMKSETSFKLGVYLSKLWKAAEDRLKAHTVADAGETVWYIELPAETPNFGTLSRSFELRYFFDAGLTDTSGSVDIKAEFLTEKPAEPFGFGTFTDMNNEGYTITKVDGKNDTWRVVWGENRVSNWAKAKLSVIAYDNEYKFLALTFNSAKANKVGVYVNDVAWKAHTALAVGTDTWVLSVPDGMSGDFDIIFYFDGGADTSGDVTIKAEFLKEEPFNAEAITPSSGFTVTAIDNGYSVKWVMPKSDYVAMNITGRTEEQTYFNFTVKVLSDAEIKFGVYADGYSNSLLSQRMLKSGGKYSFSVLMNEKVLKNAQLRFFLNFGVDAGGEIDITDISFTKTQQEEKTELPEAPFGYGELEPYGTEGANSYTITTVGEKQWKIAWNENRASVWAKAKISVTSYDAEYKYIYLTFASEKASKVGIYVGGVAWKGHTALAIGNDVWTITVPGGTSGDFDLEFYFDAGSSNTTGEITMKVEFLKKLPETPLAVGELEPYGTEGANSYTITTVGEKQWKIAWNENRASVWAKTCLPITYNSEYKYVRLTFNSEKASKVGVWLDDTQWKGHTALAVGTDVWVLTVPDGTAGKFDMMFYFDAGSSNTTGEVTMKVEYLKDKPAESVKIGLMAASTGFTVTETDGGYKVGWVAEGKSAHCPLAITNWSEEYAYFNFTVTNTGSTAAKLGIYWNGWSISLLSHTEIAAGETKTFSLALPLDKITVTDFNILFFMNYNIKEAGEFTITNISFSNTQQA